MSNLPPDYAEYPRPSGGPGSGTPYGRGPGVYFDAIGESWGIVTRDLGTWAAATIVYFAITWALSLPISLLTQPMATAAQREAATTGQFGSFLGVFALQFVLNLIPMSVTAVLHVGMISMAVKKVRGEYVNVGMIFEPFRSFGTIFGSSMLYYLIVFASALACVIPSLFFTPVLLLMPVVAYLKQRNPIEALSLTYDNCKAHWLGLLGLIVIMGIVAFLGFCACLVGILITWPMYCVVWGIHYRAFFESSNSGYAEGPAAYPSA